MKKYLISAASCQENNAVIVSYDRVIIDYFKKDFDEEEIASVEALITIYDFYVE